MSTQHRLPALVSVSALGMVVLAALASPACGGVVTAGDHGGTSDDSGLPGYGGAGNGFGGRGTAPDPGGVPPKPTFGGSPTVATCGNGRVDASEECDGYDLGAETCRSVTMGLAQGGVLRCTAACRIDTTGCQRSMGSGGVTASGGYPGIGAYTGSGGGTSLDICYAQGGLPNPSYPAECLFGASATKVCLGYGVSPCTGDCGCNLCPSSYGRCAMDRECSQLLPCAEKTGCRSAPDCVQFGCIPMVTGPALGLLDMALTCMAANGCSNGCLGLQ